MSRHMKLSTNAHNSIIHNSLKLETTWHMHIIALKKNGMLKHILTWLDIWNHLLSERSPSRRLRTHDLVSTKGRL